MNLQYSAGLILESDLLLSKANLNNLHIKASWSEKTNLYIKSEIDFYFKY